jgi:glutathione synthase/RimK-type ligase-like ATP-grasp enzyme
MTRRIAYLTGRTHRGAPVPQGQVPDFDAADLGLLRAAGAAHGLAFEVCAWDDPVWDDADAALIRSTWDYWERPAAFLARLEEAKTPVFNAPSIVRWNHSKAYLRALAAAGVPVIDTQWAERVTPEAVIAAFDAFDAAELVVKPQVGAGSRATIRLKRSAWTATDLATGPAGPAMIQPFLPGIVARGEVSIFFFGGETAHVVRKIPPAGGWFANARDAGFSASEATPEEHATARAALEAAPATALYARIDIVPGADERPRVIEAELIEPALFLTYAPWAADRLARALVLALG